MNPVFQDTWSYISRPSIYGCEGSFQRNVRLNEGCCSCSS